MVTLKIYGVDFEHTLKNPVNCERFAHGFALDSDLQRQGVDPCCGSLLRPLGRLAEAAGRLWYPGSTALFSKALHE